MNSYTIEFKDGKKIAIGVLNQDANGNIYKLLIETATQKDASSLMLHLWAEMADHIQKSTVQEKNIILAIKAEDVKSIERIQRSNG